MRNENALFKYIVVGILLAISVVLIYATIHFIVDKGYIPTTQHITYVI